MQELGRTGQTNGNDSSVWSMQNNESGERHGGVAERRSFRTPRKKGQAEYRLRGGGRTLLPSSGEAVWKAREGSTFARVGALREARIPTRGMRVHRKRGEQLLSCQREPLNLPADLLTIVPAPFRRFRLFLVPYQRGPSLLLFVASFCCSIPASFRTHRDLI